MCDTVSNMSVGRLKLFLEIIPVNSVFFLNCSFHIISNITYCTSVFINKDILLVEKHLRVKQLGLWWG